MAVTALPLNVVPREDYRAAIPQANKRMGQRDWDDIDILALAIHFGIPVWSNDNDFEEAGVEWYTTAQLLTRLGISE